MVSEIIEKVYNGERLNRDDIVTLYNSDDLFAIGKLAAYRCQQKNGEKVYFVRNHHINPTNICVNRCKFCAFSRSKDEAGAYELSVNQILEKIDRRQRETGHSFVELHIVGGLHPDWPFDYYLELLSSIKKHYPSLQIKAFTAVEIEYFSRISALDIEETLIKLKETGLDTMPGGGAEIFSQRVREKLCPEKISGKQWLKIHETAHNAGIKTNATMLYGHMETYEERADHLLQLRDLQDKTEGLQAFIPLSYHPKNTDMGGASPSGIDDLKNIAVSRLALDNVPHIKAYWIMLGEKISQTALLFGADDIDGTIIEEKITHSAGAMTEERLTVEQMRHLIKKTGKTATERDAYYNNPIH